MTINSSVIDEPTAAMRWEAKELIGDWKNCVERRLTSDKKPGLFTAIAEEFGRMASVAQAELDAILASHTCDLCEGSGQVIPNIAPHRRKTCPRCHGAGHVGNREAA